MTARYEVRATRGQSCAWADMTPVGSTDSMSDALALILHAYTVDRAVYACQRDTRPDEPHAVTDSEREALAGIMPKMARTMG